MTNGIEEYGDDAADDIVGSPDKKVKIIDDQKIERQNKEEVEISEKRNCHQEAEDYSDKNSYILQAKK